MHWYPRDGLLTRRGDNRWLQGRENNARDVRKDMGCGGDAATATDGRCRGGSWCAGNKGYKGTIACANETRGDARARINRRRGWDAMAAAWTTCRPRAVGWSGRRDHTLRAPDQTVRKGDRRDACRGHDGRCAAQQRSVPCRWWTAKSRALVRHPLGLAGGRQAPRMGLEMCTTGRNLARPLRRGRNAQAANQSPALACVSYFFDFTMPVLCLEGGVSK